MKREVEILMPVSGDRDDILKALANLEPHGELATTDVYLCEPMRGLCVQAADGRLTECLRVRIREGAATLTHKRDKFDEGGIWLYSEEAETVVGDADETLRILSALGFKELVTVESVKRYWTGDGVEVAFEEVKGLGNFIEAERIGDVEETDVSRVKEELRAYVAGLGLEVGEELNAGKPELLLRART